MIKVAVYKGSFVIYKFNQSELRLRSPYKRETSQATNRSGSDNGGHRSFFHFLATDCRFSHQSRSRKKKIIGSKNYLLEFHGENLNCEKQCYFFLWLTNIFDTQKLSQDERKKKISLHTQSRSVLLGDIFWTSLASFLRKKVFIRFFI